MEDLIKALKIFQAYMEKDTYAPFHCEHDILYVCCVDPEKVSEYDKQQLDDLGFFVSEECDGCFASHRYGSC
jgi:hypothetical protein